MKPTTTRPAKELNLLPKKLRPYARRYRGFSDREGGHIFEFPSRRARDRFLVAIGGKAVWGERFAVVRVWTSGAPKGAINLND